MINDRMNQGEILKEFWQDYHETIKPRCFRIVGRARRELETLQKKQPGKWLKIKKLVEVKTRGNHWKVILWSKVGKGGNTEIKTCIWLTYLLDGKKRVILPPSLESVKALITFTPGFFNEWRDQLLGENFKIDQTELEKQFFLWVEGNYMVYFGEEDNTQIEMNLNNKGAGIGTCKGPDSYLLKHFLGGSKIEEMRKKVGQILDPLKLWKAYNEKKIVVPEEEFYDPIKELNSIFDEIAEKYG